MFKNKIKIPISEFTIERYAKARLSFSGGPHAPINMADSMENAGSWTVSGSKEAMEVPKNFKDLRKLGVRNIAQYSAANVPFPAFFSTDIHFFHTIRHVYRSVWPAREAKPRFGATLVRSAHDCETHLLAEYSLGRAVPKFIPTPGLWNSFKKCPVGEEP